MDFYTEICLAGTVDEHKEVCAKYNKDYDLVYKCIDLAIKRDMMSTNCDKKVFHQRIVSALKEKNL